MEGSPAASRRPRDLGLDLGTSCTRVTGRRRQFYLEEPSTLARDIRTGRVLAAGRAAEAMRGRHPHFVEVIRPLHRGTVADFFAARQLLAVFFRRLGGPNPFYRPRVVLGQPQDTSVVEERALVEAARLAGAREVFLLAKPVAALLGLGLEVETATGRLVVDLGGGSSEIAVVALGRVVSGRRLPGGGEVLDQAIQAYLRKRHHLEVGARTAEALKLAAGHAGPPETAVTGPARGVDLLTGLPRAVQVAGDELGEVLREPLEAVAAAVRGVLEKVPPQLASDIAEQGLYLAGGGALLPGVPDFFRRRLGLPVHLPDQPQLAVARGLGATLERLAPPHRLAVRRG